MSMDSAHSKPASATPLSAAMLRELRAISKTGEPDDLYEYHGAEHLAFYARDKVLSALLRRGLIEAIENSAFALTDAGRATLTKATGAKP